MTTAAVAAIVSLAIALALVSGGAITAIILIVRRLGAATKRGDDAVDQATDARVARADQEAELERVSFELEFTTAALRRTTARAAALEEVLADEVDAAPNPDLAVDDVRSRVRRLAQRWAAADPGLAGGAVLAGPGGALSPPPAADTADAPAVSGDGPVR